MKILIAEDNSFSRTLLKKTLTKAGYDVVAVEDGNAAWSVLQQDDPPKLALIDWMMPGMSGVEICRKLRQTDTSMPVYVILLTAKTDKEDVLEGFSAGADDFIKKPFDSGELMARILVGKRLVEQQALMHCLIDSIPDPIYMKDNRGMYLGCNAAYARFVGTDAKGIHSKTTSDILSGSEAQQEHMEDLRVVANGESVEIEGWVTGINGEQRYHSTIKMPYLESAAGSTGMISISRDLTQEKAAEKHLRQQQKMNAVGELAGGVAHDFNNILTAILGYVALCMNAVEEDSKLYRYLQEIVKAGDRATKLVRQILTFSRQEEQQFQEMELHPIIEDSLSMVQTTLKKNVTLEKEIDADCGAVFGDPTQLQQVVINLCTNAAHALGRDNPGTLSVRLKQVELFEEDLDKQMIDLTPGHYACIKISDTGCGIPADIIDRIFEPYFTTKKKGEGTGFGLSIVHGIVKKHMGSISVESEEGKGTCFTLYFPLLADPASLESDAPVPAAASSGHGHVLFVDDDDQVRVMGREILESYGYTVVTANNGRQGLDEFRQDAERFDVIVTDYSMPDMNGHDLIKQVLNLRQDIPAILCSGFMDKVEGEDLKTLGHAAYMAKPIDWGELSRMIKQELAKRA